MIPTAQRQVTMTTSTCLNHFDSTAVYSVYLPTTAATEPIDCNQFEVSISCGPLHRDPLLEEFLSALWAHECWVRTRRLRSLEGAPDPQPLRPQRRICCRPPRTRGKVSFRPSVLKRARRFPETA